jgi:hypothetical protein
MIDFGDQPDQEEDPPFDRDRDLSRWPFGLSDGLRSRRDHRSSSFVGEYFS